METCLPNGLLLAFYGDDFTGSTDGMEALAKAGLRTVLFLDPPAPEDLARFPGLRAIGVAGISRSLPLAEMEGELAPLFARLRALPIPLFHTKICSTFDSSPEIGSIGRTIELGQAAFHSAFVPLVVGAPVLNRFCVFGNLFARSGPESAVFRLDRHPTMARHPVTPMDESDLRVHLGRQTAKPIGLVDVVTLDAGLDATASALSELRNARNEIVLFDTLTAAHLPTIGRLLWQQAISEGPLFTVGSSGVEYALTSYWRERGWLPPAPTFHAEQVSPLLAVSGSASPVTARQIEWALANGWDEVALDPARLLSREDSEAERQAAVARAVASLASGRSVVLHTCRGPEDPRLLATVRAVESESSAGETGGRRLGRQLGLLLCAALEAFPARRVVVAGGDTSGYVARELGITALEVVTPMAPGSPLCRVFAPDSRLDGLEILFKGGQVGRIDLFGSIARGSV